MTNQLFESLGMRWNRTAISPIAPTINSIERATFRFHRMLPEFVWDASVLEGNPFTFQEVKTLMDGVTVGGRKLSDQDQVLNLVESSKRLLAMVRTNRFGLDKATFVELHGLVARNEALEWGLFRGEGQETNYTPDVSLGEYGRYTPLPTIAGGLNLHKVFIEGLMSLESQVPNPFEKATAFFLFGALQQFFFDGNKRTSRFMMNGILMSHGMDAISVPAARAQEFNEKMARFYLTKDATEMMVFLVDCHPDMQDIRAANPVLDSAVASSQSVVPSLMGNLIGRLGGLLEAGARPGEVVSGEPMNAADMTGTAKDHTKPKGPK